MSFRGHCPRPIFLSISKSVHPQFQVQGATGWFTDQESLVYPGLQWSKKFLQGTSLAFIVGSQNILTDHAHGGKDDFWKISQAPVRRGCGGDVLSVEGKVTVNYNVKCKLVVIAPSSCSLHEALAYTFQVMRCGGWGAAFASPEWFFFTLNFQHNSKKIKGGQSRFTHVSTKNTESILVLLLIIAVLFSVGTTASPLLPTLCIHNRKPRL